MQTISTKANIIVIPSKGPPIRFHHLSSPHECMVYVRAKVNVLLDGGCKYCGRSIVQFGDGQCNDMMDCSESMSL